MGQVLELTGRHHARSPARLPDLASPWVGFSHTCTSPNHSPSPTALIAAFPKCYDRKALTFRAYDPVFRL